jgi:hypothetical protein
VRSQRVGRRWGGEAGRDHLVHLFKDRGLERDRRSLVPAREVSKSLVPAPRKSYYA